MEAALIATFAVIALMALFGLIKVLNWVWLRPKKLERLLREQGFQGNPYRILVGDTKELAKMHIEAKSKPMKLSDDIAPHVQSYVQQTINKYGQNSFIWLGPKPRVNITDPELIKDIFNKIYDFPKPNRSPLIKLLTGGLASYEGEKWSKHRRIINPAFNLEKLKVMGKLYALLGIVVNCS